ncbi:hypothetical protein [Noviherbaspirillum agri]
MIANDGQIIVKGKRKLILFKQICSEKCGRTPRGVSKKSHVVVDSITVTTRPLTPQRLQNRKNAEHAGSGQLMTGMKRKASCQAAL